MSLGWFLTTDVCSFCHCAPTLLTLKSYFSRSIRTASHGFYGVSSHLKIEGIISPSTHSQGWNSLFYDPPVKHTNRNDGFFKGPNPNVAIPRQTPSCRFLVGKATCRQASDLGSRDCRHMEPTCGVAITFSVCHFSSFSGSYTPTSKIKHLESLQWSWLHTVHCLDCHGHGVPCLWRSNYSSSVCLLRMPRIADALSQYTPRYVAHGRPSSKP
ncbi:hypothetical protein B0T14DRAFT_528081 [Immersiella caudata]|uniref:Uncharacterized protein n=1 Tax=Immersiella caudata TaxID=314043 RepID=A0AA39WF50_9PEZI|nr:hypothetical protein B0T14DRAFT_528081 [Immersiella caudata]